jgi:transcription elongation GreA/GreB family factor
MQILKPVQRKALERALASVRELEPSIAFMEEIAGVSPMYKERVQQLRERQKYLAELAERALVIDSSSL